MQPGIREHAEVKARVGELEAEGVFPVDAGAHGVGGLPVTEGLEELEECHKSQPPRSQAGLTAGGVELAEALVLVEGAELVAQPRDQRALREGRAGHAHGVSRDRADRLRVQAHGSPPCWIAPKFADSVRWWSPSRAGACTS